MIAWMLYTVARERPRRARGARGRIDRSQPRLPGAMGLDWCPDARCRPHRTRAVPSRPGCRADEPTAADPRAVDCCAARRAVVDEHDSGRVSTSFGERWTNGSCRSRNSPNGACHGRRRPTPSSVGRSPRRRSWFSSFSCNSGFYARAAAGRDRRAGRSGASRAECRTGRDRRSPT